MPNRDDFPCGELFKIYELGFFRLAKDVFTNQNIIRLSVFREARTQHIDLNIARRYLLFLFKQIILPKEFDRLANVCRPSSIEDNLGLLFS